MAKTKARKRPRPPAVIEGPVKHVSCGWVSDGAEFYEGAGCPKCGEPILEADCEEVTEGQLVDDDDEEDDDDAAAEEEEEDEEDLDDEDLEDEDEDDEKE